jgi:hypothetical protein
MYSAGRRQHDDDAVGQDNRLVDVVRHKKNCARAFPIRIDKGGI